MVFLFFSIDRIDWENRDNRKQSTKGVFSIGESANWEPCLPFLVPFECRAYGRLLEQSSIGRNNVVSEITHHDSTVNSRPYINNASVPPNNNIWNEAKAGSDLNKAIWDFSSTIENGDL